MQTEKEHNTERINCFKCIYFFKTWENKFPNGCAKMNFKSKDYPSVVVMRTSKMPCMLFEKKPEK